MLRFVFFSSSNDYEFLQNPTESHSCDNPHSGKLLSVNICRHVCQKLQFLADFNFLPKVADKKYQEKSIQQAVTKVMFWIRSDLLTFLHFCDISFVSECAYGCDI